MGDLVEVTTWPHHKSLFYKVTTNALCVELKAQTAVIVLVEEPFPLEGRVGFKIILGLHGKSFIQRCGPPIPYSEPTAPTPTPEILSSHEYRGLWVTWYGANLRIGLAGQTEPFMTHSLEPNQSLALQYFSLSIDQDHSNQPVSWRFALSPVKLNPKQVKPVKGGKTEWIKVDDQLPDNALIGGYCKTQQENLYIIRAEHRGSITPGKFVPSEGVGYVPWGGAANEKEEFEVLCGFNAQWVPTSHLWLPAGVIVGGKSEDRGEILYIGRAYHQGHLIPGKVQPSHKVCYIPYENKEVAKKEYEILVDPEHARRDDAVMLEQARFR